MPTGANPSSKEFIETNPAVRRLLYDDKKSQKRDEEFSTRNSSEVVLYDAVAAVDVFSRPQQMCEAMKELTSYTISIPAPFGAKEMYRTVARQQNKPNDM